MIEVALAPLLAKMATTAAIVIVAALAAERAGPQVGGLIASLPISAGPSYVFLAMGNDDAFMSGVGLGGLFSNAVTALYLLFLATFGARLPALPLFVSGLLAWAVANAILRQVPETLAFALAANVACYGVAIALARRMRFPPPSGRAARGWIDLFLRALLVAALVGTVVTVSDLVGPSMTGVVALFPVSFTSVGLMIHARLGGQACAAAMASGLAAMLGFTAGLVLLHLGAQPLGRWTALALGLDSCLAWAGFLLWLRRPRRRGAPARP